MPFRGSRVKALREIHRITQKSLAALCEVRQSQVSGWETGAEPTFTQLERLADLLDCTTDYLLGRTWNHVDTREAASRMSFDVFAADPSVSEIWRDRCARVLGHHAAPVTALAWRHLAEQIDRAVPWGGEPYPRAVNQKLA